MFHCAGWHEVGVVAINVHLGRPGSIRSTVAAVSWKSNNLATSFINKRKHVVSELWSETDTEADTEVYYETNYTKEEADRWYELLFSSSRQNKHDNVYRYTRQ